MRTILTQEQKQDLKNIKQILKEEKEVRTYPNELSFDLDNTYKNNLYYYPKTINPYNDEASKSMIYFSNLYSSLLEYDQYGNLKGGLASSCMYNDYHSKECELEQIEVTACQGCSSVILLLSSMDSAGDIRRTASQKQYPI